MRFSSKLMTALLIQPFGVISLFLTVWYLGNYVDIEAQGYFSSLKAQIDLLTVLLALGFPQAVIYQINSAGASRRALLAAAAPYAIIVGVVLIAGKSLWDRMMTSSGGDAVWASPIIITTVALLVFHRIVRGLFVTVHDDWRFSAITIAPMVALMAFVIVGPEVTQERLQWSYLYSSSIAVIVTLWLLRGGLGGGVPPAWRAMLYTGLPVFLQSAVMALQPVVAFAWIRHSPEALQGAALFSLGLYAYNAGVLPITMIAPLLLNRWSSETPGLALQALKRTAIVAMALLPAMALCGTVAEPLLLWLFEQSYHDAVYSIRIMLLAIPFAAITLLSMPAFMAMGKFAINAALAIFRLLAMAAILFGAEAWMTTDRMTPSELVAISWLLAEALVALVIFVLMSGYERRLRYN